jgi:hypothetical protein
MIQVMRPVVVDKLYSSVVNSTLLVLLPNIHTS